MRATQGGVTLSDIDDMTFHELVAWWLEAQQFKRMSK
jgi:hypothetical protein